MNVAKPRGKLYLIGAGPGDPELLTLKAVRVLNQCDVVLYDRLVSQEVLAFAPPHALRLYVGKHQGEQQQTQAEIFALIRQHASAGRFVARLKGGDPLVFGRGGEEWALARAAGVPVELVPGVSSAVSVPGLAGIPLTYRGVSQSFAVITGHCQNGLEHSWKDFVRVQTLVILMGVKNRVAIAKALIEAGRDCAEPAAFVQRGALTNSETIEATLGEIAAGQVVAHNPAVWIIGQVVRLRSQLSSGVLGE